MAFDLTKPDGNEATWPLYDAEIRENIRAIVQDLLRMDFTNGVLGIGGAAVTGQLATFYGETFRIGAEAGSVGLRWRSTAASEIHAANYNFRHRRVSVPTVSLSGFGFTSNISAVTVPAVFVTGFRMEATANAANTDTYDVDGVYTTSA